MTLVHGTYRPLWVGRFTRMHEEVILCVHGTGGITRVAAAAAGGGIIGRRVRKAKGAHVVGTVVGNAGVTNPSCPSET